MSAISLYLTATTANSWRSLSEATQAAATNTDGWVVGTGSTNHSEYFVGVERAASTFTGTTVPDGSLDTTNFDAFRSTNPYTGDFASANWTFTFNVCSVTSTTGQDGRIRFRLFKANSDGSSATEITSAQQQGALITDLAASPGNESGLTFNPGAFSIDNQYLFVQIAWERTGAASMTTADVNWRTGQSSSLGTRIVTAEFSPRIAITGAASTVSVGTVGIGHDNAPTGIASTISVGSVIADRAEAITGLSSTVSVGTVIADHSIPASGNSITLSAGTPAVDYSVAVTGGIVTLSAGDITASIESGLNINLTGIAMAGSVGDLSAARNISLTGLSSTLSVGTLTVDHGISINGAVATLSAGSVIGDHDIAVPGNAVSLLSGIIAPDRSINLSGIGSVLSAGDLLAAIAHALSGVGITLSAGDVVYNAGGDLVLALTGETVIFGIGSLLIEKGIALSGVSVISAPGSLVTGRDIALPGVASILYAGDLFRSIDPSPFKRILVIAEGERQDVISGADRIFIAPGTNRTYTVN
jgi:hypothetical protein